jgi:hypothetical protein
LSYYREGAIGVEVYKPCAYLRGLEFPPQQRGPLVLFECGCCVVWLRRATFLSSTPDSPRALGPAQRCVDRVCSTVQCHASPSQGKRLAFEKIADSLDRHHALFRCLIGYVPRPRKRTGDSADSVDLDEDSTIPRSRIGTLVVTATTVVGNPLKHIQFVILSLCRLRSHCLLSMHASNIPRT